MFFFFSTWNQACPCLYTDSIEVPLLRQGIGLVLRPVMSRKIRAGERDIASDM